MRLDKFISKAAIASRREIKQMILAGIVKVDSAVILDPLYDVAEDCTSVTVDGKPAIPQPTRVLMLNKPAGYLSVTKDDEKPTVMELLPPQFRDIRFYPVGRLDLETEGLLLFTNDGWFAERILRPENPIHKRYYAKHFGTVNDDDIEAFKSGIVLDGKTQCKSAVLEPIAPGESYITVTEGKYHQVRRMMWERHHHVNYLRRESIGALTLGDLPLGEMRELTPEETELIFE